MVYCPSCGTQNDDTSLYCQNCGTSIESPAKPIQNEYAVPTQPQHQPNQPQYQPNPPQSSIPNININVNQPNIATQPTGPTVIRIGQRKDPTIALILSLFFPGMGFAYNGNTGKAIGVFIVTIILYFIFIGIFVHIWSIIASYQECKRINLSMGYIN